MNRFIRDILIVLCVFIVSLLIWEYLIVLFSKNEYTYKRKYLENHSNEVEVLILGASNAYNCLNPHLFGDSAFNAATSARWIYYDMLLLKRYVPQMSKLKYVVFTMDYESPFITSHHYGNLENTYSHINFRHEKYMDLWYDRFPCNIIDWFAIWHGGRSVMIPNEIPCDSLGYEPLLGKITETQWKNFQLSGNIGNDKNGEIQAIEFCGYLREIAKICSENKCRLVVVTPPFHTSILHSINDDARQLLLNIIEEIKNDYQIIYLDYLFDERFSADSLWHDPGHLNPIGTDMLSAIVYDEITENK